MTAVPFRGAMLPSLGLHVSSIAFGVMHFPMRRELWPWTVFALVIGYGLGILTLASGHIVGAVVAHILINWLNQPL